MRFKLRPAASLVLAAAAVASGVLVTGAPAAAAVTAVPLAAKPSDDILVDEAHQRLYVSVPDLDQVLVRNLDGSAVTTISGLSNPQELALSPDGGHVYVIEQGEASLGRISTADHSVTHITLANVCPMSLTVTGGQVWFGYRTCNGPSGGLGRIDSAAATATTFLTEQWNTLPLVRALPDHPERLTALGTGGQAFVYDVSSGTPVSVVRGSIDLDGGSGCYDAALLAGGTRVALDCGSQYKFIIADTTDLSVQGSFQAKDAANAIAVSPDGRYVALGTGGLYAPDVHIYDTQSGLPGTWLRDYEFGHNVYLNDGTLAWGANGLLYAAAGNHYDASSLQLLTDAKTPQPLLRVGAMSAVQVLSNSGLSRVVVTGTVSCDKTTDVHLNGTLHQTVGGTQRDMAILFDVRCTAGVPRAWSYEISSYYSQYFAPGPATVGIQAQPTDPDYAGYLATGSSAFELRVRRTSPFGRRG